MNKAVESIRKSLQKRKEVMEKHLATRETFFKNREAILQEIEAAREIWKNTLQHLIK